ncbi:MAG: hypothetical protein LBS27_11700 [Bifidobacteriaceae bacterium]|nr:hypothetical protein [Bifidobacteriaceae bacterium]
MTVREQDGHFAGKVNGEFDSSTLAGLRSLYKDAGYDLPLAAGTDEGFVLDEFVEVAAGPVRVIEAAAEGTRVDDAVALIRVVIGEPWVSARVTILDAEALPEGAEVAVTAEGAEVLSASVGTVGDYQADGTPGYEVTIPVSIEWFETLDGAQQATIKPTSVTPVGPAVPAAAVREDAKGAYVLAAGTGGETAPDQRARTAGADGVEDGTFERVPITITGQVGGYALIAPDEVLPVGRRIVVSGSGAAGS